jgi:2'-5' RNA ligase
LRLFIGIACPCTPVISRLLANLPGEPEGAADSRAAGLRVVAPDSLHITLKFIGTAAAPALPDIVSAMQRALANCNAFTLQLRGAGSFQSALWLGVEPNPALSGLATALNEAMAALGYARETKPFRPHLTLARLTHPPATPCPTQKRLNPGFDLQPWITQHQADQWGNLPVTAVHLYRSDTLPDAGRYPVLSTVPLRPPAA